MRAGPTGNAAVVQRIPQRAEIVLEKCVRNWCRASWRGRFGYIPADAVVLGLPPATLPADERDAFLADLGLHETGLTRVIRAGYELLGLITFFTAGPKEARAWTVHRGAKAPEAAGEIQTKGVRLSERLYVPEPFSESQKCEIAERRRAHLALLHSPESAVQFKMALVVGEFKVVETAPYGRKVWLKHLPDCPLFIDSKSWVRIERVFAPLFEARDADTKIKLRLVMCALIYAKREHIYQIDTANFMLVTDNWIPLEGVHEIDLIHHLTEQSRRFPKPLRYERAE